MLYRQGDYKLVAFVRKIAAAVVDIIYFVLVILNLVVEQKVGRFFFKPCKKAFRNVDEIIGVDDIFYRVFASYDNGRGDAGIRNLIFKIFYCFRFEFFYVAVADLSGNADKPVVVNTDGRGCFDDLS